MIRRIRRWVNRKSFMKKVQNLPCCDDWWHTLLTSPPQSYTAEQVQEHFSQRRLTSESRESKV